MGTTEDLLKLKEKITTAQTEKTRLEGRLQEAMARLKSEFGVGSVEEGRAKLTVMQADLDRLDTEIEDGVKALMKKMEKAA